MNDSQEPGNTPVELVFGGWNPEQSTVDLSLRAARSLGSHSRGIESCEVLLARQHRTTEIRIDVRAAEGEVHVDRLTVGSDKEQLDAELRKAFTQVAHALDAAREVRAPHAATAESERLEWSSPPCTWYG